MASDEPVERRLAAILSADMVGYSRLMEADEEQIIARQKAHRSELIDPKISAHRGRLFKLMGDGMLVEFASVVDAVQCAIEIQQSMASREDGVPEATRIRYRIGINVGDIIIDGEDILGDGVNVAARLEGLAEPGGICISHSVHQAVAGKSDMTFEDLGEQHVKNIKRPLRVFGVNIDQNTSKHKSDFTGIAKVVSDQPSIAVLAFDNMSGDPDQEYFSDGISEDIITGLSRIKNLLTIARNSSFSYKGQKVDVRRIGRELGVRYILGGSVRKGGNQVRVTSQLIDTQSGGQVWADRFDGNLDDIFELQDDITAKVLTAVGTEITLAEIERAARKRPDNLDAWDRYLRAISLYHQNSKIAHEQAKLILTEAIELDPSFSKAYALLSLFYVNAGFHAWEASARKAMTDAENLAQKAINLDYENDTAHLALGWIQCFNSLPKQAVESLKRAIEINPSNSGAHGLLVSAFGFQGFIDEALEAFRQANRGSPRDPDRYLWFIGVMNAHFSVENYKECVEAGERAILLRPNFYGGHFITAAALPYLGRIEDAQNAIKNALNVTPRMTLSKTKQNPIFVRENDVARLLEGLRLAGLPE